MNFKQRLFRYMIGVGIGVILSAFFFKDKAHLWTSWLPGNRVLDRIEASYFDLSPLAACQLDCHGIDVPGFKKACQSADVDFKHSETQGESKTYRLIFPQDAVIRSCDLILKDSIATPIDIKGNNTCTCP